MPRRARIFSGKSLRSRAASSSPTTSPRSFLPISRMPPCALANPQTHFRYSSRHDRFHSRFCASRARAASRSAISGNATPASSPVRPVAPRTRDSRGGARPSSGERRRASPIPRPPRMRSRGCCPASTSEIDRRVTPQIPSAPAASRKKAPPARSRLALAMSRIPRLLAAGHQPEARGRSSAKSNGRRVRSNTTRTKRFRLSFTSSGSVPLKRRMARRIRSQPRPRRSHEAEDDHRVRHHFVPGTGRSPGTGLLDRHVVRQGPRARDDDPVGKDFEENLGPGDRVVAVDDRVHQRLTEGFGRHRRDVLAVEPIVDLPPSQTAEPAGGATHLIFQIPLAFRRAQHLGCLVAAVVGGALDEQAPGVRTGLRLLSEHEEPVERRPQDAVEILGDAGVAKIVFARRLQRRLQVETLRGKEPANRAEVEGFDRNGGNDLPLRQHEAERVEEFLPLRWRGSTVARPRRNQNRPSYENGSYPR